MATIVVPSAGDSATATWAASVANALNAVGCVLLRTAALSINNDTDTVVTYPSGSVTEQLDTAGFHDTGSLTARITIPSGGAGWYDLGANVTFATDADGYRQLSIELNGGTVGTGTTIARMQVDAAATVPTSLAVSTFYHLAVGDFVTSYVRHTAGAAINLSAADWAPRFWAMRRFPT